MSALVQTDGSVPNKLSVWNVDICKVDSSPSLCAVHVPSQHVMQAPLSRGSGLCARSLIKGGMLYINVAEGGGSGGAQIR